MTFGMPTLIEINGLEETMELCRELGLHFVELNMNLPQYQLNQMEKIEELKGLKDKYQLFYFIGNFVNLVVAKKCLPER